MKKPINKLLSSIYVRTKLLYILLLFVATRSLLGHQDMESNLRTNTIRQGLFDKQKLRLNYMILIRFSKGVGINLCIASMVIDSGKQNKSLILSSYN